MTCTGVQKCNSIRRSLILYYFINYYSILSIVFSSYHNKLHYYVWNNVNDIIFTVSYSSWIIIKMSLKGYKLMVLIFHFRLIYHSKSWSYYHENRFKKHWLRKFCSIEHVTATGRTEIVISFNKYFMSAQWNRLNVINVKWKTKIIVK